MFVNSFHLWSPILVLNLALRVKTLPSQFHRIRDSSNPDVALVEPSSISYDSSLLDPDLSSLVINSESPEDSSHFLALPPAVGDSTQPISNDAETLGTDLTSSGQNTGLGDLGSTSDLGDFPLVGDTSGLGGPSPDVTDSASSSDLFAGEKLDESTTTLASVPSDPLGAEIASSNIDSITDLASQTAGQPDLVSSSDLFTANGLDGSSSTLASVSPDLVTSDEKIPLDDGSNSGLETPGSIFDSTDPLVPAVDPSYSTLDETQGTLVASTKKAAQEGTTLVPTCPGHKIPACCSTKPSVVPETRGFKSGCISCTYGIRRCLPTF